MASIPVFFSLWASNARAIPSSSPSMWVALVSRYRSPGGVVGGGAFVVRTGAEHESNQGVTEKEVGYEIGDVATVWDGEVAGMAGGLAEVRTERNILILGRRRSGEEGSRRSKGTRELREVDVRGGASGSGQDKEERNTWRETEKT